MIEVRGQYTSAKIFTNYIEEEALKQIYNLMNHPISDGETIRIQADAHAGKGCVIGLCMTLNNDMICPNLIGVDISCSVLAINLGKINAIHFDKLDKHIRKNIPLGPEVREKKHQDLEDAFKILFPKEKYLDFLEELEILQKKINKKNLTMNRVLCSIGSLGGGNHFISLDKDDDKNIWCQIHSGSRNLGLSTAEFHQKIAKDTCPIHVKGLEYLTGSKKEAYLKDVQLVSKYSMLSRFIMAIEVVDFFKLDIKKLDRIESMHNFIDVKNKIMRKGATSAQKDERLIIPFNMLDGSIICKGLGNEDYLFSAPHGAGRKMSRAEAKEKIDLDHYRKTMKNSGIWTSSVSKDTLDEAPMAYKKPEDIINHIGNTVEIITKLKPIYFIKDGREEK